MASLAFVTACFSGIIQNKPNENNVHRLPEMTQSNPVNFISMSRAGYFTLFERRDNASAVYNEFRQFDGLISKLARCTLTRGKLHSSKIIFLSLPSLNLYTALRTE